MLTSVLKSIMRLFALTVRSMPSKDVIKIRGVVESYIYELTNYHEAEEYLMMYDFYISQIKQTKPDRREKFLSKLAIKKIILTQEINEGLNSKQKRLLYIKLLEILSSNYDDAYTRDYVRIVASVFSISFEEADDCYNFIFRDIYNCSYFDNFLLINGKDYCELPVKHVKHEWIEGDVVFLYLHSIDAYFFKNVLEDDQLMLNGKAVLPNNIYMFNSGDSLRSFKIEPIYFSMVFQKYHLEKLESKTTLFCQDVSYTFPRSSNGIKPFNLIAGSGQLVGIMGSSGSGKTTLLNIINGNLKPKTGNVYINGFDIQKDSKDIRGLIGYVPQDDLLIEELTVYQNLYFNGRLCLSDKTKEEIDEKVFEVLRALELYEIKDLIVGSPLKKIISGGQRKRLNIALELLREPSILLLDEPTSGLSSTDSEKLINILKGQTFKGKLIIVNIHQPSSTIFKQFDKLFLMDKGGYPVYYGNPLDALLYFKENLNKINSAQSECLSCGNVNPEQILNLIEEKSLNEFGEDDKKRKTSPEEWYNLYRSKLELKPDNKTRKRIKQPLLLKVPGIFQQFLIFSKRNFISRFKDKQFALITLLESPVLALILSYFSKYFGKVGGNEMKYLFFENENLPAYLFMSVVVAIFLGLMVSAEQIIRDNKIIAREKFLHLSRLSYVNSKVVFLFIISAIQMLFFVLIGNSILEIKGMGFSYWLLLFTVACNANLMGLNISSGLKTIVAIYILIPLLLVPQLLLSGSIIKFDKLHKNLTSQEYVPVSGDLMASRWAYEALLVHQYAANKFQNNFIDLNYKESSYSYMVNYLVPELESMLQNAFWHLRRGNKSEYTQILFNLRLNSQDLKVFKGYETFIQALNDEKFEQLDDEQLYQAKNFLQQVRQYYSRNLSSVIKDKDARILNWADKLGGKNILLDIKDSHTNKSLEDLVLNKQESNKVFLHKKKLIRKFEPIFFIADSKWGNSHFLAFKKRIGNWLMDTYWYNIIVLWIMTGIFYVALYFDWLKKLSNVISFKK